MKALFIAAASAIVLSSVAAQATPARPVGGIEPQSMISDAQFTTRRVVVRRTRVCSVETIRTRTPRGVVIRKIRRCR